MKISLWWIGKTQHPYVEIIQRYEKRIRRFNPFEIREFSVKKGHNPEHLKSIEGQTYLKHLDTSDHIILLDENGPSYSSPGFAKYLEHLLHDSSKRLVFVIGGPYGFSKEMYNRADTQLSLSKMTFTHDMVRVLFLEQLYRAFSIKNNLPYHHI